MAMALMKSFLVITRLACGFFQIIFSSMFELTRREQSLIAGFLFVLVLGLGVKHWRETHPGEIPADAQAPNKY